MDIQVEKLQLIEWLARLNNTTILKQFIALKKETKTGGIRLVMKKNQK